MQFSASNNMQMLLNILCSLPLDNKLSINTAKCVSMITSPKIAKFKQPLSLLLRLGSANIIQSNAIKILGVKLTDNLSWDTQVKHVQSVVNSMIGVLRRFSASLNTDARLKIFNAFILPRITYCLPVWGNGSVTATSKLDRCLLQSVRIMLNSSAAELNESVFSSTAILPFYCLVFLKKFKCIFKLLQTDTHLRYLYSGLLKIRRLN